MKRSRALLDAQAVILCGGLGSRLRSVVSDRPKCLAPIDGRPFLEFPLLWLRSFGIREVILCVGYEGHQVMAALGTGECWDMKLAYSFESLPLGTGGALKNAESRVLKDPFLVLNGDSMLEVALDELVRFHRERRAVATLALCQVPSAGRYGSVRTDADGRIAEFYEKGQGERRRGNSSSRARPINGGVYVCSKNIFEMIPSTPSQVSLEREVFPVLTGLGLYGFPSGGYFIDIGLPEDYQRAQEELPKRFPAC